MKVAYIGSAKQATFDGVVFEKGKPTEYSGRLGDKLKTNRFFEVAPEKAQSAKQGKAKESKKEQAQGKASSGE